MPDIEMLTPDNYCRQPWKNGGGELVNIANEGTGSWQNMGVAWQYGRTSIIASGPFSDLTGYDRRQVVIKGHGLVLVTAAGDIDLREPFRPVEYDGATPIVTRLDSGPVEVVNLISDRARFRTRLRVGVAGETLVSEPGVLIVHAASGAASFRLSGSTCALSDDHSLRSTHAFPVTVEMISGRVLLASVHAIAL